MPLPDYFFERVFTELLQQMEGVKALSERLARQPLGVDGQACVAGIHEAAVSVRSILSSSVDLRAAAASGVVLEPAPLRLQDFMDRVQERWERRAADGGVTLLVSYDGAPESTVMVDARRLMQVFDGFIAQAVASVRRGAIEASLRVADEGVGGVRLEGRIRGGAARSDRDHELDVRDVEQLFGLETALGVALGRLTVEAMSGDLRREANRGAGETLVFGFTAPRAAEPEAPAPESASPNRATHILVVDDNATNRMVAETLCEMFDCTSEPAEDGVEAVEAARTGRFDLILMDIRMPRMDGVAATKAIRALGGQAGRVPIIALTANADPEDAAGYLAAGMNGVVEKPMKPENLLRALQTALGEDASSPAAAA